MKHTVTLIPGDGIGPEVVNATLIALEATGVQFQWEECLEVGTAAVDAGKEPLPEDVLASIRKIKWLSKAL